MTVPAIKYFQFKEAEFFNILNKIIFLQKCQYNQS